MRISGPTSVPPQHAAQHSLSRAAQSNRTGHPSTANDAGLPTEDPLREAFHDFVGQTFFGQMIASMRSTQNEPAYFHGGQAEKIFQGQFDQQMAETLSEKSASKIADPMFHLFQLKQR